MRRDFIRKKKKKERYRYRYIHMMFAFIYRDTGSSQTWWL
jgi:hypothetical protein